MTNTEILSRLEKDLDGIQPKTIFDRVAKETRLGKRSPRPDPEMSPMERMYRDIEDDRRAREREDRELERERLEEERYRMIRHDLSSSPSVPHHAYKQWFLWKRKIAVAPELADRTPLLVRCFEDSWGEWVANNIHWQRSHHRHCDDLPDLL